AHTEAEGGLVDRGRERKVPRVDVDERKGVGNRVGEHRDRIVIADESVADVADGDTQFERPTGGKAVGRAGVDHDPRDIWRRVAGERDTVHAVDEVDVFRIDEGDVAPELP